MINDFLNIIKNFFIFAIMALIVALVILSVFLYLEFNIIVNSFDMLMDYMNYKRDTFVWIVVIENLIFIFYALYMQKARNERSNCEIKTITLEKLSENWLTKEDRERKAVRLSEYDIREETPSKMIIAIFEKPLTKKMFNVFINPYMKKASQSELNIVISLLNMLEVDAYDIPSVSSYNKNDIEKKILEKNIIGPNGEKNYDVCATYTLYDHTLRVVKIMIELMLEDNSKIPDRKFPSGIIAALSHDIGKIKNLTVFNHDVDAELLSSNNHNKISVNIFNQIFPNYINKTEVSQAIESHHQTTTSSTPLDKLLLKADKLARDQETTMWLKKQKKNNDISEYKEHKEELNKHLGNDYVDSKISNGKIQEKSIEKLIEVTSDGGNMFKALSQVGKNKDKITKEKVVIKDKGTKKTKAKSNTNKKPQPTHLVEPIEFDLESIERDILTKLTDLLHTPLKFDESKQPKWMPYKSHILIKYSFLKEVLPEFLPDTDKANLDGYTKFYVKSLVSSDEIDFINIRRGHYLSTFNLTFNDKSSKYLVIPFKCEYFGLTASQAVELSKSNFQIKSYSVKKYTSA